MKSTQARWLLWLPLLAGAAWLAVFGDKAPARGEPSLPTRATPTKADRAVQPPTATEEAMAFTEDAAFPLVPRAQLLARDATRVDAARDLFSSRQWNPPAPPAAIPASAPPPAPPPLPFAYLGKKLEGGTWEIFLARGEQSYLVREGQILEGQYRVDRIDPPNLTLTYLPLGQAQTLAIGDVR